MQRIILLCCVQLSVLLAGCTKSAKVATPDAMAQMEAAPDAKVERKLIKEGSVTFRTSDISATRDSVAAAVGRLGGYVGSEQVSNSENRRSATLILRVPAQSFDLLLAKVTAGVERLDDKQVEVKDVTEEYVDVSARLAARKSLEARYIELLKQAKNVAEMMEVERQLGEVREEIESAEGRVRYLDNQVAFATLTVTFYEEFGGLSLPSRFREAFTNGGRMVVDLLVLMANLWALALVGLVGWWIWRRVRRS